MVHPPDAVATAAAVVGALRPHQVTLVAQLPQLPLCGGEQTSTEEGAHSDAQTYQLLPQSTGSAARATETFLFLLSLRYKQAPLP